MGEYFRKGFKISYPDFIKKKDDFPYFKLTNTKHETLYFYLHNSGITARFLTTDAWGNPIVKTNMSVETLRTGEYQKFPGSEQDAGQETLPDGSVNYFWRLLIPIGQRVVDVKLSATTKNVEELEKLWVPIIDSMEFDEVVIDKIPDYKPPVKAINWTKVTDEKPKRNKISLPIENSMAGLWDSETEFYDAEGDLEEAINEESFSRKFIKSPHKLILFSIHDPLEVPVELYFKVEAPELSKWDHVFEGLIDTPSGMLCFGSGEPFIKIKTQIGVYKFRVYLADDGRDVDDESSEHWRIYLWPTDQPETDEVKILKP